MNTKELKKNSVLIIFLAWLAYMISYLGRSDYSACILEIVNESGVTRATAGMVSSAFALCNAIGQILSGFIIRKISPVKIIGIELFTVAIINFFFPNSNSFWLMAILWGINGCMQSTLLCSATQIFLETLREPYLSRGVVLLNTIGAVGGAVNYILSWVMIRYVSWKAVFITVATMLFLLAVIWCRIMPKLVTKSKKQMPAAENMQKRSSENAPPENNALYPQKSFFMQLTSYGTIFVIFGALFIGLLRESVSLWIPSYMNEEFGFSSSLSTIVTMFVPCLQVCGALLGGKIGRKTPILHFPAGFAFALSGMCLSLLLFAGGRIAVLTILLFVINAISMTAALTFLLSLFPIRFFGKGQAPVLVGFINFSVHAGDFFASAGIGWLSEAGGWLLTFGILGGLAFIAAVICIIGGIICKEEVRKENGKNYL